MDVQVNFDGSAQKRLGSNQQNADSLGGVGGGGFIQDSNSTLTNNLVAWFKLDEPSGERRDTFDNRLLKDFNNVTAKAGIQGNAACLEGQSVENYLYTPNAVETHAFTTGDIDFSFSFWVYLDSVSNNSIKHFISKRLIGSPFGGVDEHTVLMLHGEDTEGSIRIVDSSQFLHAITLSGNTHITTAGVAVGSGTVVYDGTSDYLQTTNTLPALSFGSGDFTVEGWFSPANTSDNAGRVMIKLFEGATDPNIYLEQHNNNAWNFVVRNQVNIVGTTIAQPDRKYHLAGVRSSNNFALYVDGNQEGNTVEFTGNVCVNPTVFIGREDIINATYWGGKVDELRVSNVARYSNNFTINSSQFTENSQQEYIVGLGTDDIPFFQVSGAGTQSDGQIAASSFGALNTGTWYNINVTHDTAGNSISICVNDTKSTLENYTSGLFAGSAPFVIGGDSAGSTTFFDGRVDELGYWTKVLDAQEKTDLFNGGDGNTIKASFPGYIWGMFDFGASNIRWLTVAAGTGLYASSDLGVNFTVYGTSQTATFTHFERSKNVQIVTSDAYDPVLQWDGSGGTHAVLMNPSAPNVKYAINFQGFLILMNSETQKRLFAYEDVNTQLTGDWADSFELPSTQDDQITGAAILRKNLYVSLRNRIYRLSYVGGNPDWSFLEVKDWGYAPRTMQKISLQDVGEVIVGLANDGKIKVFDGADDRIISDNVERDNNMSGFALDNLSFAGSGLNLSHSVVDQDTQEYKLCCAVGVGSTETTHVLNLNARNLAFYPYQNQGFQAMAMVESANQRFLMAGDRSGYVYLLNSGNLDFGATAIDDVLDTSFISEKSPAEFAKAHKIDLFFSPLSSGTVYLQNRPDFTMDWSDPDELIFADTSNRAQMHFDSDVPQSQSVVQFRLSSSAGTAEPWRLNRLDYFLSGKGISAGKD